MDKFSRYLNRFEQDVAYPMFHNGDVNTLRLVSTKPGKLSFTQYGAVIGTVLEWKIPAVIDYYGLHKKSVGCLSAIQAIGNVSVRMPVLSFASVHLDHIVRYCPEIVSGFAEFKWKLIELRGFKIPKGKENE